MKRVNFFNGQLLTAEDLKTDQDYFLVRHRRQNLRQFGRGVVSGLQVSVKGDHGNQIEISPGVAIDAYGREIILSDRQKVSLPCSVKRAVVFTRYTEHLTTPVATPSGSEFSRVEEASIV